MTTPHGTNYLKAPFTRSDNVNMDTRVHASMDNVYIFLMGINILLLLGDESKMNGKFEIALSSCYFIFL